MIFSFGNLFTLLAVLFILVIYRQIDRNNRSLEKVKRFSDKITENLKKMVDDRTAEVKDLSIELEVNLKTGKEILKRVQGVEERLNKRGVDLNGIQTRLKEYDSVLNELINMTAVVDENLKRIRSESLFVDKVGKRIHNSAAKLEKVENEISQIHKKFIHENSNNLQCLRKEISADVEDRIKELGREVEGSEQKVKDFSSYIMRVETRRINLEKETEASLKKSLERFELEGKAKRTSLANQFVSSLNKLLSEADNRGKAVRKSIESCITNAERRLEEQEKMLAVTAKKGESLEARVFLNLKEMISKDSMVVLKRSEILKKNLAEVNAFRDQLKEQFNSLKKSVDRFKVDALEKVELAADGIQTSVLQRIDKKLENYEGEVDYRFNKLQEANVDIEALEANLRQFMDKMNAKIKEEMQAFLKKSALELAAEEEKAKAEFSSLKAGMKELEDELLELKSGAYQNVSEQLQVFEDDFFTDLKERNLAMDERVRKWQNDMENRILEISSGLVSEREIVEMKYTQDLKAALDKIKHNFMDQLGRMENHVDNFERSVSERITGSEQTIASFGENINRHIEGIRQEALNTFKKDLNILNESVAEDMRKISRDSEERLKEMRDEFTVQRDDLIVATNQERSDLKNELKNISDSIIELENALNERSESALKNLEKELGAFQIDFVKRTKELQEDMDGRIRDIDKRVKSFISQTKLFERTDELKLTLDGHIEEMKREIDRLRAQQVEVQGIGSQLSNTKKMTEEVTAKLNKIFNERRRIEDMDSDFKKLMTISRDLDLRIETVYSSQDSLQEILAKIREIENLERIMENRYERLEKRKGIVEDTTAGVDKSFQLLNSLEKNLGSVQDEVVEFTEKIEGLRSDVEHLIANKEKADSVVGKLKDMDKILESLETRTTKLDTARQWLARTETRFETIGQQAQEQVKLLESILKAESKQAGSDKGAPPLDKRETVIKLAHLGWGPREIARTTKLSRGEVELILELAPQKK